jgi:hypothetical protein
MIRVLVILLLLPLFAARGATPESAKKEVKPKAPGPVKYRYTSLLGMGIAQGSSLIIGGKLGFPVSDREPAYAGPEIAFALYSPGTIYAILGTFWYDISLDQAKKLMLSLGASTGLAATDGLRKYPGVTYAAFFDAAIGQEVDQDVLIRAQFRPGVIGKYFAFWMGLNATFLFRQ